MALNLTGQRQPKPKVGVVAACAVAPVVTAADVASKTSLVNQNEYSGKQVSALIVIKASNGDLSIALGKGLDATDKWQPFTMGAAITPAPVAALSLSTDLPATKTAAPASDVTFTIVAAGGHKPLTYQWYYESILIDPAINPSAATASLVNHAVTTESSGNYHAVVTDSLGNVVTSTTCALTVA